MQESDRAVLMSSPSGVPCTESVTGLGYMLLLLLLLLCLQHM